MAYIGTFSNCVSQNIYEIFTPHIYKTIYARSCLRDTFPSTAGKMMICIIYLHIFACRVKSHIFKNISVDNVEHANKLDISVSDVVVTQTIANVQHANVRQAKCI